MTKRRNLFDELIEGFDSLADQCAGKRTLCVHVLKAERAPRITPRELTKVRQDMDLSRGLFAGYPGTNVRTLENWEQGRARLRRLP
jgi:putative transcriptional regulator